MAQPSTTPAFDVVGTIARFNRRVVNPLVRPVANRLPGVAVVCHIGRSSGRSFETPVRVFNEGGTFFVMIPASRLPDWVRNLQAGGGGLLRFRGRSVAVGVPRLTDGAEALAAASGFQGMWRRRIATSTRFVALATP